MTDTNKILEERAKTHGDYKDTARIIQSLKHVVLVELGNRQKRGQVALTSTQRESIDMIVHKIGRIISGNPATQEHWDDIAGYAKLVSNEILAEQKQAYRELSTGSVARPTTIIEAESARDDARTGPIGEVVENG